MQLSTNIKEGNYDTVNLRHHYYILCADLDAYFSQYFRLLTLMHGQPRQSFCVFLKKNYTIIN
jgi:hypothetical protein